MNDIESRAREYLAKHSEYSEVFGQTFVAVDTLTAMVEFSKQETKELEEKLKLLSEYVSDLYILGYSSKNLSKLVQDKIAKILGEWEKNEKTKKIHPPN